MLPLSKVTIQNQHFNVCYNKCTFPVIFKRNFFLKMIKCNRKSLIYMKQIFIFIIKNKKILFFLLIKFGKKIFIAKLQILFCIQFTVFLFLFVDLSFLLSSLSVKFFLPEKKKD